MDTLPLHPQLVHFPLVLAVIMPVVTLFVLIAWWRGWIPGRAWIGVIVLQAVLVGSGFLAMRTGEADEERVEEVVAESLIEGHEEAAERLVWTGGALLLLMAGVMWVRKESVRRIVAAVVGLGTVAIVVLAVTVGGSGGRLVYQHGAAQAYTQRSPDGPAQDNAAVGKRRAGDDDEDSD